MDMLACDAALIIHCHKLRHLLPCLAYLQALPRQTIKAAALPSPPQAFSKSPSASTKRLDGPLKRQTTIQSTKTPPPVLLYRTPSSHPHQPHPTRRPNASSRGPSVSDDTASFYRPPVPRQSLAPPPLDCIRWGHETLLHRPILPSYLRRGCSIRGQ